MVLVTGAGGFIGSHLVDMMVAAGNPVRCLLRRRKVKRTLPADAEIAYGDLVTGEGVQEAVRGASIIIHLAGVTKALRAEDYYEGNVRATQSLVRAASSRGVRFVHVSSLAAVGPSSDGVPLGEDAEPHPVSHYGKSKLQAEHLVRAHIPDAVIVRPPVVYGPRDTDVFQLLQSVSRGWVLEIAGGDRWFSAIYVRDLAAALMVAAQCSMAAGRTYFASHSQPVSWTEFGAIAARLMSRQPRVLRVPGTIAYGVGACAELWSRMTSRPGIISREKVAEARCRYWTCESGRASRELGFEASTDLQSGLAMTLAWYKEAGWLKY